MNYILTTVVYSILTYFQQLHYAAFVDMPVFVEWLIGKKNV